LVRRKVENIQMPSAMPLRSSALTTRRRRRQGILRTPVRRHPGRVRIVGWVNWGTFAAPCNAPQEGVAKHCGEFCRGSASSTNQYAVELNQYATMEAVAWIARFEGQLADLPNKWGFAGNPRLRASYRGARPRGPKAKSDKEPSATCAPS
jgi:hypothetical protein